MRRSIVVALLLFVAAAAEGYAQRIRLSMEQSELEAAVEKEPSDAISHYNLALGYWSKGSYDLSANALKQAIALEPRLAIAYLALALLPFAEREDLWNEWLEDRVPVEWRDRLIESDRLYRTAFMMNPLVDLRIFGAVTPRKSYVWDADPYLGAVYNEWLRGYDDFRDGEYGAAYLRLDRLARDMTVGRSNVKNLPFSLLWHRGLAAAHVFKYDESIRDLRELLNRSLEEEDPTMLTYMPLESNTYRLVLAAVLRRANRPEEAATLYREVLELDAGSYLAHVALADLAEAQGDAEKSLAHRRAAAAANPEDFTSEIELAVVLARTGRIPEAQAALERAAAVQPLSPRPWYLLGLVHEALGRPADARAAFERFLEVAPSRYANEIADAQNRLSRMED